MASATCPVCGHKKHLIGIDVTAVVAGNLERLKNKQIKIAETLLLVCGSCAKKLSKKSDA